MRTYSKANATRRMERNVKAEEALSAEQINRFCEWAGEEGEAGRGTHKRVLQKTPTLWFEIKSAYEKKRWVLGTNRLFCAKNDGHFRWQFFRRRD